MKIDERMVTSVPAPETVVVNFELLRQYIKINAIDEKINEAKKIREKCLTSIRSVVEVKKDLKKHIEGAYLLEAEVELKKAVDDYQKRKGRIDEVASALKEYVNRKHLAKETYLIKTDDFERGVPEGKKLEEVAKLDNEIIKLQKQRQKLIPLGMTNWINKMAQLVEKWKKVAPYFANPVTVGGIYLNGKDPNDEQWLDVYKELKLGDIPKFRLYKPAVVNGKEFTIHPGHYFGK